MSRTIEREHGAPEAESGAGRDTGGADGLAQARSLLRAFGHDLRGALNVLHLNLQMLDGTLGIAPTPERRQQALRQMSGQVKEMVRLIDRLGEAERVLGGTLVGEARPVDLSELLAEAAREVAARTGTEIGLSNDAGGPVTGRGDATRLRRLVETLLEGPPPVRARLTVAGEAARIEVHVAESPGPEAVAAVRAPDLTAVARAGNLGRPLELWLACAAARALGGHLQVHDGPAEACFVLELPLDGPDGC